MSKKLYNITVRADENYGEKDIEKTLRAVYGKRFFKKFKVLEQLGLFDKLVESLFSCEWVRLPMSADALARLQKLNTSFLKKGSQPVIRITDRRVTIVEEIEYLAVRPHHYDSDPDVCIIVLLDKSLNEECSSVVRDKDLSSVKLGSLLLAKVPFSYWLVSYDFLIHLVTEHEEPLNFSGETCVFTRDEVIWNPVFSELADVVDEDEVSHQRLNRFVEMLNE